jgi:four helix bundle protein
MEKQNMNYKDLEIWKLANNIALEIHEMTLKDLPGFEKYESGSQIRRSSKSVKSNIVEGYGRRQSKKEFLQFLRYALGSNHETMDHLETLFSTGSLKNLNKYNYLQGKLNELGKKLTMFIKAVEKKHRS